MPEIDPILDRLAEIGARDYQRLANNLNSRESERYTTLEWGGDTEELTEQVESNSVSPTAAFVIVAKGLVDFRATGSQVTESSESLRELGGILEDGYAICDESGGVDPRLVAKQIKNWMQRHSQDSSGLDSVELWKEVIGKAAQRAIKKAELLEDWDSAR